MAIHNRYVILFGGLDKQMEYRDNIFVYCIKNKTLVRSKQKCPTKSFFTAITVGDRSKDKDAVYGYVRNTWEICEIEDQIISMQPYSKKHRNI